ncbi:MAG: glycosyltransferase [Planctomycetes bacterium]|nr:glycosyltransferase [Planctomycetota bacterium]
MKPEARSTLGAIRAVICNYNGREHLPPCLAALRAQTRVPDELIVVDNASEDGSREALAREHPDVRLVALERNEGPCPSRNLGLELVEDEWVLLLDNDAVLASDALEKLERAALEHPDAVLLQPRSVFDGESDVVHYDGGDLHYCGLFSLRNFHVPLARAAGSGTLEVGGAIAVALLVKRSVLRELGGFDPAYFVLFEDLDLSLRLRMAGHRILSVEDALCRHRGGTAGISYRGPMDYPRRRAFLHSRNRWIHLVKNHSWRTLCLSAPALFVYELVWALFTLSSGTFRGYLQGKWAFVREIARTLRARARVQRTRRVRDGQLLVGGPLSIAPQLHRGGARSLVLRSLDLGLRTWWAAIRPLC